MCPTTTESYPEANPRLLIGKEDNNSAKRLGVPKLRGTQSAWFLNFLLMKNNASEALETLSAKNMLANLEMIRNSALGIGE